MPVYSMGWLWPQFAMEIASGRLSVLVPAFLQQPDLGFWGNVEPPKSKDGCAHGYARCALQHGTTTARTQRRRRGGRDVARVANVMKHAVKPIAERDEVVPRHLGSPLRTQRLNHFRKPRPLSIARCHSAAFFTLAAASAAARSAASGIAARFLDSRLLVVSGSECDVDQLMNFQKTHGDLSALRHHAHGQTQLG